MSQLSPVFRGQQRDGHQIPGWNCSRGRALRHGPWKLVRSSDDRDWELYNLDQDTCETNNLAKTFPERVQGLSEQYEIWRQRVGAR